MQQNSRIPNRELSNAGSTRSYQQSETYAYKVLGGEKTCAYTTQVPTDGTWGRDGLGAVARLPIDNGFNDYAAPFAVQMPSNYVPLRGMPQLPVLAQPKINSHNVFSPYL